MKCAVLCALLISPVLFAQNASDTLTNETIIRMVQAGVPSNVIIQTIAAAPRVNFSFLPGDLQAITQYRVPDDVFKAMAARDKGTSIVGAPVIAAPQPSQIPPRAAPVRSAPRPAPPSDEYQGAGMWNLDLEGSVLIPHISASDTVGLVIADGGYFVTRGLLIGGTVSALFQRNVHNVTLGAGGRYFFGHRTSRVLPYIGAAAGGTVGEAFGFGTSAHFSAEAGGGIRFFIVPHVAMDLGYELIYVRFPGAGFKESSISAITVGFAHVFGRPR